MSAINRFFIPETDSGSSGRSEHTVRTRPWRVSLTRRATSDLQRELLEKSSPSLLFEIPKKFENEKYFKGDCIQFWEKIRYVAFSVSKKYFVQNKNSAKLKKLTYIWEIIVPTWIVQYVCSVSLIIWFFPPQGMIKMACTASWKKFRIVSVDVRI